MKIGVVTFPGTLDDRDAARAVRLAGGEAVSLWHADTNLHKVDAVVLPGGFSYGDYLRCGAIAAHSPIMTDVVDAANKGMPVLGICNGFQTLVRLGVLPGKHRAALGHNEVGGFQCSWISMKPTSKRSVWTQNLTEEIYCPIAHGEGRFTASDETLSHLRENDQIALTYSGRNPNGSCDDIAGICDETGFVLGLMPHPENHVVARQHPQFHRGHAHGLGLRLFEQGVAIARS